MVLMTLIPALGSLRQVDFYKYEATLLYRVSSQTAGLCRETLFQKTGKGDTDCHFGPRDLRQIPYLSFPHL